MIINIIHKRVISIFFIGIIVCSVYLFAEKNKMLAVNEEKESVQDYSVTQENVEIPEEFYSFKGKWVVREYIDSAVEPHGVDTDAEEYKRYHEEYVLEMKEKYGDCIFEIYEDSIDYFFPPTELGYYCDDYSMLFDIYRQPYTIEIVPPFLCASIQLKQSDEVINIIIDSNGKAVLVVEHCFFKLDRVDVNVSETNSIRDNLNNETSAIIEAPVQTYEDYYDLPFEELNFIDEEGYEELKQIYAQIDFNSDFKKGDIDSYDFYIKKYRQLVNNENMFYDARWDEDYYPDQYGQLKNREHSQYDPYKYTYFFFDIDGDSYPELGVTERDPVTKMKRFIYVFKYEAIADRMIMWYNTESVYSQMMGTGKMRADKDGRYYYFDQLDINGKEEMTIRFVIEGFFTNGKITYLVTSPWYRDQDNDIFLSKALETQGYYTEQEERFYFRVTEEQFKELTERYFLVTEESEKNLEDVSYTYVELFGDD